MQLFSIASTRYNSEDIYNLQLNAVPADLPPCSQLAELFCLWFAASTSSTLYHGHVVPTPPPSV